MLLKLYRYLPWFKGKLRLEKFLFPHVINSAGPFHFTGHGNILYSIPNTKENLGLELLINGIYESDIVKFLKENIADNMVYFDIGANIGSLGLPIVKSKKGIHYHGFEASPFVYSFLEKNFKSNNFINYALINKLVHKDGEQSMKFYQSDLYGKNSLAPTYSSDFIMMDSMSIDAYCKENKIDEVDWIKVDVQGFELYVFEGMQGLLQDKKVHNILFEFEPWAEEQAKVPIGSAKDFIKRLDYSLYTLSGKLWDFGNNHKDTMIWAKPNK